MDTYTFDFATFDAFIEHAATAKSEMQTANRSSRQSSDYRLMFTGTRTFPEALDLARQGWDDGTKQMLEMLDFIERFTLQQVMRPDLRMDVIGDAIDIGVFCEGRPDCCQEWIEGDETSKDQGEAITLQINLGANSKVKAEMIMTRGAAIVALVSALESAGRRVRVIGVSQVSGASCPNVAIRCIVPLKNEGEAVDISRIAFALASPAMLRRMVFSVRETAPKYYRRAATVTATGTYGVSMPHIEALQPNTIVFDRIEPTEHWTTESAKRWVLAVLNGLGVQTGDGADSERLRPDYDAPVYVEARERWDREQANRPQQSSPMPEMPKPDITTDER